MEEIITKGAISSAGFFACIGLQGVNTIISTIVGFATLLFLVGVQPKGRFYFKNKWVPNY
mgnify:CR=1 FL=1